MLRSTTPPASLDALFTPRSIALVGVSDKPGSYGQAMDTMCCSGGYAGRIMRVNPRLAQPGAGIYAALADLPEIPDHVVLGVATDRVEAATDEALASGARAITIFAECPDTAMRQRLGEKVRAAGAVLCGPNSMGLHELTGGLRISPFPAPLDRKAGGIGLIAQSGSILGALVNNAPQLRFSQAVSTGSETVTTAADYLGWMAARPETTCIGLFLETVRDPDGFMQALQTASEKDIPVVILKVGRSALGARMAISHTGAMVGDDAVFRAMARRYGAHLAGTVDEMAAMLAVFSQGRRAPASGLASIHDSGGERELIADLAESAGLHFADLSAATRNAMQKVLEPGVAAENPLDAWATGRNAQSSFAGVTRAMMADPEVGVGLYVLNWRDNYELHAMHERALSAAFAGVDKPLFAVSNYALSDHKALAARLASQGIPLIGGLQNALSAVKALVSHQPMAARALPPEPNPAAEGWRDRLSAAEWIGEAEGYALFESYGIAVPRHGLARSREEALAIAQDIAGPVILKTAKPKLSHKSDVGGVRPGLATPEAIAAAYDDMAERLSPDALVAQMLAPGSEWSLGAVNDPHFGPVVRIAPGGLLVDLMPEQALLLAPFTAEEARAAILSLRASITLSGYRGQPPKALDALAQNAAALSRLTWDLRDVLAEAEINPVIVGEAGATAADAVIRTRNA
ncbi:acetate--CoA ligase family protein [Leisingera sp. D0M16]|uniref:acetate--CoA ligase family protein n=1 Tax=Leisingera coralii TaxID=3351347 RepID=UPI003B797C9C